MDQRNSTDRDLIFWDVDTQADFVLPGGRLYAQGAEQIVPNLARLTQFARENQVLVVSSTDAHQPDEDEFSQWPPHCVMGTPGQEKIQQTQLAPQLVVPPEPMELPRDLSRFQQVVVHKRTTDVFTNPNLEGLLSLLGKPEVILYGLVTEVCVILAARRLLDLGYRVRIVTDAICPLNKEEGEKALAQLKLRGAELLKTQEVLDQLSKPRGEGGAKVGIPR